MKTTITHIILLWVIIISSIFSVENPWEGKWHISSQEGTYIFNLEQDGDTVNGTFEPSNGIIKGEVKEHILYATGVAENNKTNTITLTMGESQNTFFGNESVSSRWLAGTRVTENNTLNTLHINREKPGNLLYSFLALGNSVRSGNHEELQRAIALLEFTEEQKKLRHANRMEVVRTLFQILDECIINKRIFVRTGDKEINNILLEQVGSDIRIPLKFIQNEKTKLWKIQVPELVVVKEQLKSLLVAREKYEVDPKDNLELKHARATMRTLYEQYDHWENGGQDDVISTMNLSEIDPSIHDWQAPLLAYYLKSVLDRISYVIYQEIPNDPKSKKPYLHFHHPAGSIVIEPYIVDDKTVWQFTPQTLASIDELYYEMHHVKSHTLTKVLEENNLYFTLKKVAKDISPLLINKVYYTELWQILMLVLIIVFALLINLVIRYGIFYLFKQYPLTKRWTIEMVTLRYLRPLQIVIFGMVLLYGAHQLGLSNSLFSIIKSFSHLLIVVGSTWIIYNLITIIFSVLQIHASKTSTDVDEIIISLTGSILRILVITAAIFIVAEIFSVPYQTVLAGLGIGGLAFAIAAKDTIANFFGSAIIVADRPFKTGDIVKIGSDMGKIINVGIRSTTVRTLHDTVLTIPNNKITREMIDNYSKRESFRFETEFFFALDTTKETLDQLDKAIAQYLEDSHKVNHDKLLLTGANDYTRKGILYQIVFFVNAKTIQDYSEYRHQMITELADIIKGLDIKLNSIEYTSIENSDEL